LRKLIEELLALDGELLRLASSFFGFPVVSRSMMVETAALELIAAVDVALQHAHAQGPQLLHHVVAQDPERLGGVAGDQHALALGEQVPDQVGDGVRFPVPGGP